MDVNIALTITFGILASIGGAHGIISFIGWLKNRNAKIKMLSSYARWYTYQEDLCVEVKLHIFNQKKEFVYITDLLASIKEDSSKKKDGKGFVFSKRPRFSPVKIEGKSSIELDATFVFGKLDIHPIKRIGFANLMGFYQNVPIMIADEEQFEDKWDELPLELKLTMHLNGEEKTFYKIAVFDKVDSENHGTLNPVEIAQIEQEYLSENKK